MSLNRRRPVTHYKSYSSPQRSTFPTPFLQRTHQTYHTMEPFSLDFPLAPSTPTQELPSPVGFPSPMASTAMMATAAANYALSSGFAQHRHFGYKSPKRKWTKLLNVSVSGTNSSLGLSLNKPRPKKPDPSAPKITRPCSECGRKFWSWKALFGHMRCHPERQWRGINPPPQFRRETPSPRSQPAYHRNMTDDEHEVASCLLLLANSGSVVSNPVTSITVADVDVLDCPDRYGSKVLMITNGEIGSSGHEIVEGSGISSIGCQFECSSCKKTFRSHQALGGHRATHKNVKGCFAITRNDGLPMVAEEGATDDSRNERVAADSGTCGGADRDKMVVDIGNHRCSICLRTFTSGQALGGHMRCHWERTDEPLLVTPRDGSSGLDLNLNLPAPLEDPGCFPGVQLELKLGI